MTASLLPWPCTGTLFPAAADLGAHSQIPGSGQATLPADREGLCSAPRARSPSCPFPGGAQHCPGLGGHREKPGRGGTPGEVDVFLTSTPASMANWDVPHHSGAAEGREMLKQPGLGWCHSPVPPYTQQLGGAGATAAAASRRDIILPARSRVVTGDWQLPRPAGREPLPDAIFSLLTLRFLLDCLPSPEQSRAEHRRCLSCLAPDGM